MNALRAALSILVLSGGAIALAGETVEGSLPAASETVPVASEAAPPHLGEREVIRRLSGTRWALELQPMFGQQRDQRTADTLSFNGSEMTSEMFAAGGFASSTITITVGEDGVPVWEATQLNPSQGIALWHGELHEHTINGTVSKCPLKGATEDFLFVGQEAAAAPEPAASSGPSATPAEPVSSELLPAPEQKDPR